MIKTICFLTHRIYYIPRFLYCIKTASAFSLLYLCYNNKYLLKKRLTWRKCEEDEWGIKYFDRLWNHWRRYHKTYPRARYPQIEESEQKKQVRRLQYEDTWASSMLPTLFSITQKPGSENMYKDQTFWWDCLIFVGIVGKDLTSTVWSAEQNYRGSFGRQISLQIGDEKSVISKCLFGC